MKLHENCGAVRLHLLLVAIFIYATAHSQHLYQPRLIEGSPNAWSYKGAGTAGNPPLVSGVPSITYNIPAGKNRVMFISVFIERNQGTYPNSNLAYDPDGVGFYSLSYGSAKVGNLQI